MIRLTILGNPVTKKNNMQIVRQGNRPSLIQSKRYRQYEKDFIIQVTGKHKLQIDQPVNVKCIYYRATRHRVDLTNLMAATHDCLVKAEVLKDDNYTIIKSVDGSEVRHDKHNPRVEITIEQRNED